MAVIDALWEIECAIDDTFGPRERARDRCKVRSYRNMYEVTLREVREEAGTEAMYVLACWIEEQIRTRDRLPSGSEVRRRAADICRGSGRGLSTGAPPGV